MMMNLILLFLPITLINMITISTLRSFEDQDNFSVFNLSIVLSAPRQKQHYNHTTTTNCSTFFTAKVTLNCISIWSWLYILKMVQSLRVDRLGPWLWTPSAQVYDIKNWIFKLLVLYGCATNNDSWAD